MREYIYEIRIRVDPRARFSFEDEKMKQTTRRTDEEDRVRDVQSRRTDETRLRSPVKRL